MAGDAGLVFNVQRYSIHDGPGIRTVVFLKGCPLRCQWCCNPESQRPVPEVEFLASKCTQCGTCLAVCPRGAVNSDLARAEGWKICRARCDDCGECVEACPNRALSMVGKGVTVDEVVAQVEKDRAYYRRSGGGVTLSGGEPLSQPEFAANILRACRARNIHTALETCGHAPWAAFEAVLPHLDLVQFDLKFLDSEQHRCWTGADNALIVANLRRVAESGAPLVVRVPLVPRVNSAPAEVMEMANFAATLHPSEVNIMPFHQLGRDKYARLDRHYALGDRKALLDDAWGRDLIANARLVYWTRLMKVTVGG